MLVVRCLLIDVCRLCVVVRCVLLVGRWGVFGFFFVFLIGSLRLSVALFVDC